MKASTNSTFYTKTSFEPSKGLLLKSDMEFNVKSNLSPTALHLILTMANHRKNFDGKIAMNLNFAAEGLARKLNIKKINIAFVCARKR